MQFISLENRKPFYTESSLRGGADDIASIVRVSALGSEIFRLTDSDGVFKLQAVKRT